MIPSMMTGCKKESTSYSHTDFAMGTVTNITLYGTSDDLEGTEQKIIDMERNLKTTIVMEIKKFPGFKNQSEIRTKQRKNKSHRES